MKKLFIFFLMLFFFNILNTASALSVIVHVPEKYTNVIAGERFYFEIEVKYPENPSRKDLRLEYEILTVDGDMISQSKALKAVETQASFIDFIIIPENAKEGLHIINIRVKDYDSLSEEVSASFNIRSGNTNQLLTYFLIILSTIILVVVLVILSVVITKKKNK